MFVYKLNESLIQTINNIFLIYCTSCYVCLCLSVSLYAVVKIYSVFLCAFVYSIGRNSVEGKGQEVLLEAMEKIPNLQQFELG